MAKTKEQKKEIIAKLTDAFKNSASTVFVHFTNLSVGEETQMRRTLKKEGVSYFVAKKRLMKLAWEQSGAKGDAPQLVGEVSIAYANIDPTSAPRNVYTFVKQHKDKLQIVGGIYEGEFKNAEGMNEIATIPPVEVLRGMFVNVINSPLQGLVVALGQIADKRS